MWLLKCDKNRLNNIAYKCKRVLLIALYYLCIVIIIHLFFMEDIYSIIFQKTIFWSLFSRVHVDGIENTKKSTLSEAISMQKAAYQEFH